MQAARALADPFGRSITYLRLSVTDRCDLRCRYCMDAAPVFEPKPNVLTLEELDRLCTAFIRLGIRTIRITGGEPLTRRGIMTLFESLARPLAGGAFDELTLTTNGSLLERHADALHRCGVRRVNVSLDTLDPGRFRAITRCGELARTLAGIAAARRAGLRVKINTVVMNDTTAIELDALIAWCGSNGFDLTLIETMPIGGARASDGGQMPLTHVRDEIARRWTLTPLPDRSPGPAGYVRVAETGGRLGFIAPLSRSFCGTCNRIRVTCTGQLRLCLGGTESVDLRAILRGSESEAPLLEAIEGAISRKPREHGFAAARPRPLAHPMNTIGG